MRLVGLTGYKQSGKDTFAKVLVEEFGFTRLAFADALKRDVAEYCGITVEQVEREKAALRRVLQLRGVACRDRDPEWWVDVVRTRIARMISDAVSHGAVRQSAVITDVRFPNEAKMVRNLGGVLLRMRRSDQPMITEDTHSSETNVDLIEVDGEIACNSIMQRQNAARDFMANRVWR